MRQVWHIFQKDVRHFWRESVVAMLLLAAFSWDEVRNFATNEGATVPVGDSLGLFSYQVLPAVLAALLPLTWLFATARVIQDEALAGDRQFWLTRPYEWKSLLLSKCLFVLALVNMPLLIADVYLLSRAGFQPAHYVPGLLWMQLLIVLFFLIPLAALATVTGTISQMLLSALAVTLYLVGTGAISSMIPGSTLSPGFEPLPELVSLSVVVAVIWLQFARRKTATSRGLLGVTAFAVLLLVVAMPYRKLIAREYPRLEGNELLPVRLSLHPVQTPVTKDEPVYRDEAEIRIPLDVSGLAPESIVSVNGTMVAINAPGSFSWQSGWKTNYLSAFPGQHNAELTFSVPRKIYERMKRLPVQIRMTLAVAVFHDQKRREFVVPSGEFDLPDVGRCLTGSRYLNSLECRAPLRQPSSLLVATDISQTTCPITVNPEALAPQGTMAHHWFTNSDSAPAEFGISSVKSFSIYLSVDDRYDNVGSAARGICPGTPLTISRPELVRKLRMDLEFDAVRLLDYRWGNGGIAFVH